jgi:hypothetical protein|tara:strand:- start:528 stop:1049 length:522 start_codon:yes stop_codon:yes gene_type:complete
VNKIILLSVFLVFFIACQNPIKEISSIEKEALKKEINSSLNNWHKAASEANFEGYFGLMDSISIFIGTDASENWGLNKFKSFSKPYFDKGKAWSFETLERNVYVNNFGNFVWFDELLNTWMGTCRGSGVLEKKENSWKIKHYVLSVAIPNDDVQAVILAKKKSDALFLKQFQK